GVISSVTQAFCRTCTRARLSTDGMLYTCLFATTGYDLRVLLRGGASDREIHSAIAHIWRARDDRYSEIRTAETSKRHKIEMSYIGGGARPHRTSRNSPPPGGPGRSPSKRSTSGARRWRRRSPASIR